MIDELETVFHHWKNSPDPVISKPWAFRPAPHDDELLSSWFLRVAHGLELKPFCLAHMTWPDIPLLARDVDNMADPRIVGAMASKTCVLPERAWATTLPAYDGYLTSHYYPGGRNAWILPIGIRHRVRNRHGLQFCPICLKEFGYYQRSWRLGFVTCCLVHACRLHDCCPDCGAALEPHRSPDLHICSRCHADLTTAPFTTALKRPLDLQRRALVTLHRGWGRLGINVLGWSHLYFEVLRLVAKALAVGQRADFLRVCIARKYHGDPSPFNFSDLREIEMLSVGERHRLMDLVAAIMKDWPHRLVGSCRDAKVWHSWIVRDCERPPFIFAQVTDQYLTLREYQPSISEVWTAWLHLKKHQAPAHKKALVRLLGDCLAVDEFYRDYVDIVGRGQAPDAEGQLRRLSSFSIAETIPLE